MIVPRCVLLIAAAAVAVSVPVSQEEYVRYIAQQQTQRLEEKPEKHQPTAVPRARPIGQVVVGAYQQPAATRSAYQQPGAYQPAYQPQAYAQPSYLSPQTYQQPEEYQQQQPEEPYQAPARAPAAPRPKAGPYKPKPSNRPEKPEDEENDNNPNAQYQFSFDISDDESTNYHNRKEQRDGEKISGSYSVVDSDGFIRTVTYTADPEEGFKAEVSREPTNIHVKIPTPSPQTAAPAPQYRLPERKPQPQYIAVQASEQAESAGEQPAEPISGYYRPAPQSPVKSPAAAVHRFAAPRPQLQAGSRASALGYATGPASPPIIYQAYQQQ